jgi:monomeric sarcosine oxidase
MVMMAGQRATNDVAVIGAGTMGAWTALHAVRAGLRTTLVDAYGAGHPRATSGDESRIIRAAHGDDTFYTRWSREAREQWMALGDEVGERFFVQAGALWFARRDDGFEEASLTTLRSLDVPAERLTADETARRWPQIATGDLSFSLFEPEAGLLLARRAVAAVADLATREGAVFERASARPVAEPGDRLRAVDLGDGSQLVADQFVFAAGPWLPQLFPDAVGDLIRVTKQAVSYFGTPAGDWRFDAAALPCFVDYDTSQYGIPAVDGRGIKVGDDRYGPPFDPSHGDRLVDPATVELARGYLGHRFPALAGAPVVETRVCQYETTPDTHFVIDRHPAWSNVWLVGGGSGHGFKHGPVIGRYVVDRLRGAGPGPGEARFAIDRPRVPGGYGLRTGAVDVAEGVAAADSR